MRILISIGFLLLVGCQTNPEGLAPQWLDAADTPTQKNLGEPGHPYLAMHSSLLGSQTLEAGSAEGSRLLSALASGNPGVGPTPTSPNASLVLGFPAGLLGEEQVFGGVITAVTDTNNEKLGGLKLTDLPPLHVRPYLRQSQTGGFFLELMGCATNCKETSPPGSQLKIPVLGIDKAGDKILLDLASLADELNLIRAMDPQGNYTELKTQSSRVARMEYSVSTLVFDVEVTMIPVETTAPIPPTTEFTIRWYLKLASGFHSAFVPRAPTDGVGFFQTDRRATPLVGRMPLTVSDPTARPVKYYVKNVPTEHKKAFRLAFEDWNAVFRSKTGAPLLDFEFIDASDPRSKTLVTGDPRYFIVEWDLVNAAGYGGLGPAILNQNTGEIFSANVLVQGPKIIELYTEWFEVGTRARELREAGHVAQAAQLERGFTAKLFAASATPTFSVELGELEWRVPAQDPRLQDPLFKRVGFEPLPKSLTYEQYMEGYFRELVAHEIGHNIGLRHNFFGNLSAAPQKAVGKVSSSVMEYLGRGHRHLNRIGEYDQMAVAYGYMGETPAVLDGFCTDGDVATLAKPSSNPECSRDDAGPDAFAFFEWQLTRALDLLLLESSPEVSPWTVADVKREVKEAVEGMVLYSANRASYKSWKNFFDPPGRPFFVASIGKFVRTSLTDIVCDSRIAQIANQKGTQTARRKTLQKVAALRAEVGRLAKPEFSSADLACF